MKQSVGDIATLGRAILGAAAGWMVLDPALVKPGSRSALSKKLTGKQKEVMDLMAQGYSNAAIGQRLVIAEKSVENHINAIYQHLGVSRDDPIHPRVKAVLLYMTELSPYAR